MNLKFIQQDNMTGINKAKTIHPFPVQFMVESNLDGNSSTTSIGSKQPNINNQNSVMRRGRLSSITNETTYEIPSWDSNNQLSEEVLENLEKLYSIPHSIYNKREKYIIVFLGGITGLWSSISSPIYLPVLPNLQTFFNVTEEQLNITVVVYSIFQGLAPIIFSNISDKLGRRSIIITCLIIYILANIGLALNNSFTGLILLRCLQAFGISSTLSIASGIASDITTKADRASFIGLSTGLSLLGQAFGALIGGMISTRFTWRGIFYFLAISAGITLLVDLFLLPETSRNIVGNGSSLPKKFRFITIAPILHLKHFTKRRVDKNNTIVKSKSFNMLAPLLILRNKPVLLTLIPASISYSLWLMMLTTLSNSLSKTYEYSLSQIALAYIPSGIGGLTGSITIGKLLDWCYQRNYKNYKEKIRVFKENSQLMVNNNYPKFNIFKARLSIAILPTVLSIVGSFVFGWTIHLKGPVALVLVASFLISFGAMNFLTISTTVLIDLYPNQSSGSSSCVNFTRCWCAALFIAVLSKMVQTMTVAGCYSLMAGLCSITSLCLVYLIIKSERWI